MTTRRNLIIAAASLPLATVPALAAKATHGSGLSGAAPRRRPGLDWRAIHDRLLLVVETLCHSFVCADFPREAMFADAGPVLSYTAARASSEAAGDPLQATPGERALIDFARDYGVCLDWLFNGRVGGFICNGAAEARADQFQAGRRSAYGDIQAAIHAIDGGQV